MLRTLGRSLLHPRFCALLIAGGMIVLNAAPAIAQRSPGERERPPALPTDQRLLALHREFVSGAERLATQYEREEDWDKAKAVYAEILKLVPQHQQAQLRMQMLLEREANADVTVIEVAADQGWQDTGINVIAGKPIRIRARGYWTFGLRMRLTAEGIQIPRELRQFNLGCLVGVIASGNPEEMEAFVVGNDKSLVPERNGRLYLRMYDISPEDNEGSLQVELRGSFAAANERR